VPSRDCPDVAGGVPGSGQHVACASRRPAARSTLLQNTESVAALDGGGQARIAGYWRDSNDVPHVVMARSPVDGPSA
jgi:hypothetical protein